MYLLNIEQNNAMYEIIKRDAIDLYPYLRDAYNQKREREINE